MTEMHDLLYPPKENDNEILNRRYDAKERLIAWIMKHDDVFLVFRVVSFREATLSNGTTIDVPETINCRPAMSCDDVDPSAENVYTYDRFGNRSDVTYIWTGREADADDGLRYNRARYSETQQGRMIDIDAEVQYNRARFYDPSVGRWISEDLLGYETSSDNCYPYPKAPDAKDAKGEGPSDDFAG